MLQRDPIPDDFQERFAREALQCAQSKDELIAAWWAECDTFQGDVRERLQEEYGMRLRELGVSLE